MIGRGEAAARGSAVRTTAFAGILAVALLGFGLFLLVRERLPAADPAGSVVLQQGPVTRTEVGWLVRVDVENPGSEPVGRLYVVGDLSDGRRTIESSEGVIAFLPPGASQTAALVFRTDPTGLRLILKTRSPSMR